MLTPGGVAPRNEILSKAMQIGFPNWPRLPEWIFMSESEPNLQELKIRAQTLKPTLWLGKAGATPELLAALNEALERTQLVKLRFEGFKAERKRIARELAEQAGSRLVSQVGHTAVFHRARAQETVGDEDASSDSETIPS